jgi:transcriptional regulator with XRE-family HTH domain
MEQNSKIFISSLSGVEEEISASLAHKNNKTITGAGVTDVINLFSLVSAPPLPYLNKGAEMSCFKEGEKWRWNEPQKTIQYFKCRLRNYVERNGLKISELAELLNKSIPSVSSWINGQSIPPSDIQEMIAQIVGAKSRAEIWIYKGRDITKSRIHLNKLNQEVEKIKNLIQKQLAGQVC